MVSTVSVTGRVSLPDNTYPRNADIEFTLIGPMATTTTESVIPAMVTFPVASNGTIAVSIAPNAGAYHGTRYRISVVEYTTAAKSIEWRRHDLGTVKVTSDTSIGQLTPVRLNVEPYHVMEFYKGDTISIPLQSLNDDGTRASLTGVTIRARMRHAATGVETQLTVDNINRSQGYYRVYMADTSNLSVGTYLWNLSFTANGEKTSTEFNELRIKDALA